MSESGRFSEIESGWGPAERAAIDLCFADPVTIGTPVITTPARIGLLSRTIETEIIPRLLLAHRSGEGESAVSNDHASADGVAELASAVMAEDPDAATRQVDEALARGATREGTLLNLLAPTARLLGDMWREDLCTFADVTIGLSRLQGVVRSLAEQDLIASATPSGRILLATVPGEQHTFGISILEGFFRREGWEVEECIGLSQRELVDVVRHESFDIVGLSLACDVLFDKTAPLISALRKASRNRSLLVMVGGRLFAESPERSAEAGADFVAFDAPDALRRARLCIGVAARC